MHDTSVGGVATVFVDDGDLDFAGDGEDTMIVLAFLIG